MVKHLFLALVLLVPTLAHAEQSANATANSNATVFPAITINKNQDLNFNGGVAGDPAKTVLTSDTTDSASFTVGGGTNAAYNITLPADGTVIMQTGGGGANKTIGVNTFTSSIGATGNTGAGASQSFYVGATRDPLGASQVAGSYTTTFQVTVQYQ